MERKPHGDLRWWWHVLVALSALAWGFFMYMALFGLRN